MVWPLEPEKIAVRFGEIAQADVDAAVAAERAKHAVEMEPALFERSVRLALALESVVREHGFDAFTAFDQVWLSDPRVGIIPSFGTGRLCEIGIPASPEGDVNCAVAQLVLQELAGQATTVENYVIDFDNNAVMFSHDGHGNPALGTPGETKVKHSIYYQGVHGFGAGFEFAYEPGPVTNLALVTMGENLWRFVISEGEFLPFPPRPDLGAPDALPAPRAGDRGLVRRVVPGRARRTTWPRRRAAGRASSSCSPGCSASTPSSSDGPAPGRPRPAHDAPRRATRAATREAAPQEDRWRTRASRSRRRSSRSARRRTCTAGSSSTSPGEPTS